MTRLSHTSGKAVYNVSCGTKDDDSDSCGLVLFGDYSRKAVIDKWNERHLTVEDAADDGEKRE